MARLTGIITLSILLSTFSCALAENAYGKDTPAYLLPVDGLDVDYYRKTCPKMEAVVQKMVKDLISKDYTYAASLIRLHFHDCAVRGCDASVLLDQPGTSEKYSVVSKTLRGFEFVSNVKDAVEAICPKTVSCADVLTAIARDAANAIGVPYWQLKYGRKDGKVSLSQEADGLPRGKESMTDLIVYFQSMGLSLVDLVILQGAHTIGRATCDSFGQRLQNYQGSGKPDPTLNNKYENFLTRKCKDGAIYTDLDATTPAIFDSAYYKNLLNGMGLLETDQKMLVDSRLAPIVKTMANQNNLFETQFAAAMIKLSKVNVLTGDEGEIRTKCTCVN